MRTVVVVLGAVLATARVEAQEVIDTRPTLLLRTGNPQSVPARQLYEEVRLRMGNWQVHTAPAIRGGNTTQRVAYARLDLETHDAVVWVESDRYPERLVLLMRADGRPHAIGIRRSHPRWASRAARYIEAYVRRILHRASLRARGIRSRWFSVMPRTGWALRLEGFVSLSPRHGYQSDWRRDQARVGGASIRVGRWLTRFLRLDLRAHLGSTEDDLGPQGGLGVQLALVSPTALRMGVAVGLDALLVSDVDPIIDDHYTWLGVQTWVPMVLGIDFNRNGALVVQVGPTFTKPPNQDLAIGVSGSIGLEIDLGQAEE